MFVIVEVDQSAPSLSHFRKTTPSATEPGALRVTVVNWLKVRVNCVVPSERPLLSDGFRFTAIPLFGLDDATVRVRSSGLVRVKVYAPVVSLEAKAFAQMV